MAARQLKGFVRRRSLLGNTFREHGVNCRLERDEQNARAGVSAARLVLGCPHRTPRQLCRVTCELEFLPAPQIRRQSRRR